MNRSITGRIATFNYSPTQLNKRNLLNEGVPESKIIVTGNTVIDALHMIIKKINSNESLKNEIKENLKKMGYDPERLNNNRKLVLITGHRRENFGDGFINICSAIKSLSENFPSVDFLYPMHLNPNVRKPIKEVFGDKQILNLFLIEPLNYMPFVYLMEKSTIILTDSGGIQEEAPGLGKPVLVMRDTTERPEALEAGTVKLVGTDNSRIFKEVTKLLTEQDYYNQISTAVNPYGDGKACQRIVEHLQI
jgi:UDP-N-acetylglucosamine 2-epimerase (non-hydrolysing)